MKHIEARYSTGANTLLVTCPFCKKTNHHILKVFTVKQWLGNYMCDCGQELYIETIK